MKNVSSLDSGRSRRSVSTLEWKKEDGSMAIDERVAIVTGGSRGIGRGIVGELAKLGMRLIVNYRSDKAAAEEARALALENGAHSVEVVQADIGELEQRKELVNRTLTLFNHIDLLVNNAGIAPAQAGSLGNDPGELRPTHRHKSSRSFFLDPSRRTSW